MTRAEAARRAAPALAALVARYQDADRPACDESASPAGGSRGATSEAEAS